MRYLITGGAGFIGSNFIRHLLANDPSALVTNLDLLTYAAAPGTVAELNRLNRYELVHGDICDSELVDRLMRNIDVVVNFAAESHVDRSISGPNLFVTSNVVGTAVLLDAARRNEVDRFVHISTDEVYGTLVSGRAAEDDPLNPSSPYAAAKASADLIVAAYRKTYGYEAIVTRCSNNYGPYQHPEKLIPLAILRALSGDPIPIYGDGHQQRDWLWVGDHCAAIDLVLARGVPGEVYNIASGITVSNREVTETIIELTGDGSIELVADRPGHDRRYALDISKIEALGWQPMVSLRQGLEQTVDWYRQRREWWASLFDS